jgi:aldehyde dehydrogenase (NAD+)
MLTYFETLNSGKPLSISKSEDIPYTAYVYRYFAGQTDKIKGSTLAMSPPYLGYTKKEPIGVVAQIIPWNYPLLMMAWKVAPALAAGCTVVLKPAEQTPLTALLLGELFTKAGFPAGAINIITGFGKTGEHLSQHRLISKISFTGSTEVGYLIMRNSHKHNLKPVTLELGGKSANIILPDADLDEAAKQACILFSNCGQSCIAGSRTYVHKSIYSAFVEKCVSIANSIKVGDPFSADSQLGAIISKEQFEKVLGYIEIGKKEGAVLAAGGLRVGTKGYFLRPTIFSGVTETMKIAREEIFGPVMSILEWTDEEDVIARANALPYGLGAGVVTKSLDKALKFT